MPYFRPRSNAASQICTTTTRTASSTAAWAITILPLFQSTSNTYTGGGGGNYSASGPVTASSFAAGAYAATWGTGWTDATDNSLNVRANIPKSSGTSDFLIVMALRTTVGSTTIVSTCVQTSTVSCNTVGLFIAQTGGGTTYSFYCRLEAGTITIATIASTHATGTFSGTGTCFNFANAQSSFTVTNGAFDVPFLSPAPTS